MNHTDFTPLTCGRPSGTPWIATLLALLVVFTGFANAADAGTRLPSLSGASLEGDLPATRGKVLLVDFWASWCGPCKKSFPSLEELHQRYKGRGLVVIGISVDEDAGAMHRFLRQHPVSFSIVRDREQKLVKALKIEAMPTSLLVDRSGVIRFVNSGFRGSSTEAQLQRQIEQLLQSSK